MGPEDILPIIQQYITVRGVALSVIFTQALKYMLPGPTSDKTFAVRPGTWSTRLLPFFPILVGILYCTLVEKTTDTIMENTIRGIFTGAMGAFSYRTTKVSIFGE